MIDIEDLSALEGYLRERGWVGSGERVLMQVLAGGVSNRTVLVEREDGEGWVVKQALGKLRVKVDWFSDPARIRKEAEALRRLPGLCPEGTITPLVFEDTENFILAMEAARRPHENWKNVLLDGRVEAAHVRQFGKLLGVMHRRGYEERQTLAGVFEDRSFFESLRLEPYYAYTAGRVREAERFLKELIGRTLSRRLTVVHGDYSPKNVLVREGRLILLDHEVIHFGDPAFDIGFAMAHLLSKANHLATHRDVFKGAAWRFWEAYAEALGDVPWRDELEEMCVRHSLGCLLARVEGRSPLEYLSDEERERQRGAVVDLMSRPTTRMNELINAFVERIAH